jgi:hypothetical protein
VAEVEVLAQLQLELEVVLELVVFWQPQQL